MNPHYLLPRALSVSAHPPRLTSNANPSEPQSALPDPVTFLETQLDFHPDPAQAELLLAPAHRVIVNCCRQWGKSTLTAALCVYRAVMQPGSLCLVLSPSERQSGEFLRKARTFIARLGIQPRGDGHNHLSLLFPNESRIVGLPGQDATIRGFSAVKLLIIDEASRVPDPFYHAVRPMLATSNGDLWMISTPNGKSGFFFETWVNGGANWIRYQMPATLCPRIAREFLEEELRTHGEQTFRQEYCCEFVQPVDALFRWEDIQACKNPNIPPIEPVYA